MTPEAWGAIGMLASAIVAAGGTVAVGRRAQRGDEKSQELQANAGIASGYSLLTSDLRTELNRLRDDVDSLRRDMDHVKQRYRNALAYIRLLLAFIADKAPEHTPPTPPDDLTLDVD